MKNLIKKLQENNYKVFKIVEREQIEIINAEDFESSQDGYRFNSLKNEPIEDWKTMVGENFYVIGFETDLGDPIIADTGTEGFPIYFMMHDYWESLCKIADSFDEFIDNLKAIEKIINTEHKDRTTIRKFVKSLDKSNNADGFYETLCYDVLKRDGFYYKDFQSKSAIKNK